MIKYKYKGGFIIMITYMPFSKDNCKDVLEFWANIPGIHLHSNGEDSIDGIAAFLERNTGCSFIVKDDNKIIGAIMCGHDGRRGLIHHLAVDTQYRRLGIGKKLMQMSLEQLQNVGIKKCALFVLKGNDIGESFYKSLDWKEENIVKIYAKVI
jgi:ribosomal protein S18 acetylase RimI-like enzyme